MGGVGDESADLVSAAKGRQGMSDWQRVILYQDEIATLEDGTRIWCVYVPSMARQEGVGAGGERRFEVRTVGVTRVLAGPVEGRRRKGGK